MILLKVKGTKSWLDPHSNRALASNLSHRLWERCQGRRGVFLTLTYRRDEYRDALDLYRVQSEQQHVPLFLRKVSRFVGQSFRGNWFCKMEFQKGGWVHWHIIILGIERIPHAELTRLWGRGHVWIHRLNERRVRYCCKYVSKGAPVPAWLYGERPKSVKVVRVSPGFWGESEARPKPEPDPSDEPRKRFPFYRTIGQRIEESRRTVVIRDADTGRVATCQADFGTLLVRLLERSCGVVGNDRGWVVVDAGMADIEGVLGATADDAGDRPSASGAAAAPAASAAGLHLKEVRNPDATSDIPGWLRALLEEAYSHEDIGRGVA